MAWNIIEVDNGKKRYKLEHDSGKRVSIVVPEKYHEKDLTKAFLEIHKEAYNIFLDKPKPIVIEKLPELKFERLLREAATILVASTGAFVPNIARHCHLGILAIEAISLIILLRIRRK